MRKFGVEKVDPDRKQVRAVLFDKLLLWLLLVLVTAGFVSASGTILYALLFAIGVL